MWSGLERMMTADGEQMLTTDRERSLGSYMDKRSKLIKTPFDELTYTIIGCAMASHSTLGPGFRENTYQRDLELRLAEKRIPFEAQMLYEVCGGTDLDTLIGYYIPDLVVAQQVVVEIKALPRLGSDHTAQLIG
jgi:GxxExxY protein